LLIGQAPIGNRPERPRDAAHRQAAGRRPRSGTLFPPGAAPQRDSLALGFGHCGHQRKGRGAEPARAWNSGSKCPVSAASSTGGRFSGRAAGSATLSLPGGSAYTMTAGALTSAATPAARQPPSSPATATSAAPTAVAPIAPGGQSPAGPPTNHECPCKEGQQGSRTSY